MHKQSKWLCSWRQRILHPRIFNLNTLRDSATKEAETVTSAVFPSAGNMSSLTQIASISNIAIAMMDGHLVYQVNISLKNIEKLAHFKATPFPVKQEKFRDAVFAFIWPSSKYFAVSKNKERFLQLDKEEVDECKSFGKIRVCKNNNPVHTLRTVSPCEVTLAVKQEIENVRSCKVKLTTLHYTYWRRMRQRNSWVFSAVRSERLKTNCLMLLDRTYTIEGMGIVRLPGGCSGHTNNVRLTASRTITQNSTMLMKNITLDLST